MRFVKNSERVNDVPDISKAKQANFSRSLPPIPWFLHTGDLHKYRRFLMLYPFIKKVEVDMAALAKFGTGKPFSFLFLTRKTMRWMEQGCRTFPTPQESERGPSRKISSICGILAS